MTSLVLTTRLYIPRPPRDAVVRRRLLAKLDEATDKKMVLVCAPAGFGKTTLLAQWLTAQPRSCWISLDEEHNDPVLLTAYVIEALHGLFPGLAPDIAAAMNAPFPMDVQTQVHLLINRLADEDSEFWLALDDFHLLASAEAQSVVAMLLELTPPSVHIMIATREDPSLPLARYRAQGQLSELRTNDLPFTEDEIRELGRSASTEPLPDQLIDYLAHRVEGWPAGVRMALLSSNAAVHQTFVMDYFMDEVFSRQTDEIQEFLTRTSILDCLCPALCDFVLERHDSELLLETLIRANLFLSPLDGERVWYRYHHLFAEMLARLVKPAARRELLLRASVWYEQQGELFEAFRLAAASGDIDRPAGLVISGVFEAHERMAVGSVLTWLSGLPRAERQARPALQVRQAGFLLTAGQTAEVPELLDAAEVGFERSGTGMPEWLGLIAMGRATVAVTQYRVDEVERQSRIALDLLPLGHSTPRFFAYSALGFARSLRGDRVAALAAFNEAQTLSRNLGDSFSAIMSGTNLGGLFESELRLGEAESCYQTAVERSGTFPIPYTSEALLGLARIHYQRNSLDDARRLALESAVLARRYDPRIDRYVLSELVLCRIDIADRRADAAAQRLDALEEEVVHRQMTHRLPELAAVRVTLKLAAGEVAAARSLAERYSLGPELVRVLLAEKRGQEALTQARTLRSAAESQGWADLLLNALILESLALGFLAEAEAARVLEQALERGRGLLRVFVDEGAALVPVLKLLETSYLSEVAQKVLDGLGTPVASKPEGLLSPREAEVLQLIAVGCTNDEIGSRLFIALDTVKGHNRKIFEKLGARSRTEAVANARQQKLL